MKTFPGLFIAIFAAVIVIAIVVLLYQSTAKTNKAYNDLQRTTQSADAKP